MNPNPQTSEHLPENLAQRPFRYFFKMHRRTFVAGVTTLFFTNLFDSLTPLALMAAIDRIKVKDLDGLSQAMFVYCGLMLGVTIFRYLWRIYFGRFHHSVAEDIRNRIFGKLTIFGPSFYQKNPVGQLMSLLTNDVNSFRMAIGPGVLILLDAAFLTAMIVPMMMWISLDWTWKTMILLPFVPFYMKRMEMLIHHRYRETQERLAEVSANAAEIVSGVRVIKGYAQEDHKRAVFNGVSRRYELASNRFALVDAGFEPVMDFAVASGGVALLYFCSSDVIRGTISLGAFVAFHEYIRKMVWPMSAIGMGVSLLEQGRASFDRIRDLLATETDIPDRGTIRLESFEGLEINDLTFQYPAGDRPVLSGIDLKIEAGETIGVVGPVGAGKTTLMQLICRLYAVESGKIKINGHSLEEITQASLRSLISFVPQDAFLFSDTVAENVALGLEEFPGIESVRHVTNVVNINEEIESVPEKYGAFLGERGVNLSGGQKQRLTIARALIRNSPVVILDDSLSAVDGNTETAIVSSLRQALHSRLDRRQTTILVSHRLATLKHANRIIVLGEGKIEAIGSHEKLLSSSATYRKLHLLQTEKKIDVATRGTWNESSNSAAKMGAE